MTLATAAADAGTGDTTAVDLVPLAVARLLLELAVSKGNHRVCWSGITLSGRLR